jgi:hypothetical protein
MAIGSDSLGERGELMEGMVRSVVRGDMFWWDVLELKRSRESEDGEGDVDLICSDGRAAFRSFRD